MDFRKEITAYLEDERRVLQSLDVDAISEMMNLFLQVREAGGTIYTLGNGGSSATASHFVCDYAKGATEQLGGKPFHVSCLSDNTPVLTAIANDICYEDVFVFQLRGRLRREDALLAISGSGNSENVLRAVDYAREMGVPVIGMTGYDGGRLREKADVRIHVPVCDMQLTEDVHMMLDHLMLRVFRRSMQG